MVDYAYLEIYSMAVHTQEGSLRSINRLVQELTSYCRGAANVVRKTCKFESYGYY